MGALEGDAADQPLRSATAALIAGPVLAMGLAIEVALGAGALEPPFAGFPSALHVTLIAGAAALLLLRAVSVRREREGWLLLSLAAASFAMGEAAWDVLYAGNPPAPVPSFADAFWLAFVPLAVAGLALIVRERVTPLHPILAVDGVVGALALAAIGAAVVFDPVFADTGGDPARMAVGLAHPVGTLVLLGVVVTTIALTGWRPARGWPLVLAGLVAIVAADTLWLWGTATGTYESGGMVDTIWPAAILALSVAAWQPFAGPVPVRLGGRAMLTVPVAFALVSIGTLAYSRIEPVNDVSVALALAAMVGVLLRTALTVRENLRLLEESSRDANTDQLTGLGNRRRLLADLEAELPGHPSRRRMLVLLDLDGFKDYNDAYGHSAGDALLQRLGVSLHRAARRFGGSAYRIGGDEFCALIDWEPTAQNRRLDALAEALSERGATFDIRPSYGAVALGLEADEPAPALQLADSRMYVQKASRRSDFGSEVRAVLLEALNLREPDLRNHVDGVADLSRALGRRLGMGAEDLDELVRAAELHDIGKLAIPDTILSKPAALDPAEREFMERHTLIGQAILAAAPAMRGVAAIVRSTHERWDGAGYPDRLRGIEIPLGARIVFVCDSFHAMTSSRCYRPPRSAAEALAELRRCAGTQFDPRIVAIFHEVVAKRSTAVPESVAVS